MSIERNDLLVVFIRKYEKSSERIAAEDPKSIIN